MTTESVSHGDETDVLTAEEEASGMRARANAETGHVYTDVTAEAVAAFGCLNDAEAQRLLADPGALRQWLATHA